MIGRLGNFPLVTRAPRTRDVADRNADVGDVGDVSIRTGEDQVALLHE